MSADRPARRDPGYAGLTAPVGTLPSSWYFDPAHHARELRQIWYRHWVYVCRSSELSAPRSYRTCSVGDQSLLVVRGEDSTVRAFHNTCRHRGAALCRDGAGRFPAAGIVCPYHAWRYSVSGQLLQASSALAGDGFDVRDFPLYQLPVTDWNGFVFVALAPDPAPFAASVDLPLNRVDAWELPQLVMGHRLRKIIECNWKVFWENYNECLHCPGVHPRLSQLVPIYGRALLERRDDPRWQDHVADGDPKYAGGLRRGAESWSTDGRAVGIPFPKLTAEDRSLGHLYVTSLPSMFLVAHADYVRVVRLRPLAPERTELTIEFLCLAQTLSERGGDLARAIEFTDGVMSEDAAICEVNQRGLRALPHAAGVLMPEEYAVRQFQDWVRAQLQRA